MSLVKYNSDKQTAIEFHQVAKTLGKKYSNQLEQIYMPLMGTSEGKNFIKDYLAHKNNALSFNEKSVVTKGLKAIEERRPKWKNSHQAEASKYMEQAVKDDVSAMLDKKPHPQLRFSGYEFKHFSADISTQLAISQHNEKSVKQSLQNLMTNLIELKDFSKEDIKKYLQEPVKKQKIKTDLAIDVVKMIGNE